MITEMTPCISITFLAALVLGAWTGYKVSSLVQGVKYVDLIPAGILIVGGFYGQQVIQWLQSTLIQQTDPPIASCIVSALYTYVIITSVFCLITRVWLSARSPNSPPGED